MKYFSEDHEWVEIDGDEATIGISEYAVNELGDITYVELPAEDEDLIVGDVLGVVESVKTSADIYSPISGTVSAVTMDPMWGGTVAVDHTDGTQTIYCGIAPEKALKAGDRVTAGQMLGSVDTVTAEVAMESHLHFAAKKDGKFIDPLSLPGLE